MACLTWHSKFEGQLAAFEHLGRGAILLDSKARVIAANDCVILGDGLDVRGGSLDAPRSSDRYRLHRFTSGLVNPAEAHSPPSLILPRISGGRPWLLDGISCGEAMKSLHSEASALVLVTDLDRKHALDIERLRVFFSFTPTEQALAGALLQGNSLQEAATAISISHEHARQRLKALFQKTSTSRQSELLVLLGRIVS